MTRLGWRPPLATAALMLGLAFLINTVFVTTGQVAIVPGWATAGVLTLVALLLLGFAWPVRGAAQGKRRVASEYAVGILGMAKGAIILGAGYLGTGVGALLFVLSRPVISGDMALAAAAASVAGVLLGVAGWVAEGWCKLPPDQGERGPRADAEPMPG